MSNSVRRRSGRPATLCSIPIQATQAHRDAAAKRGLAAASLLAAFAVSIHAQQLETDYSKYLNPIVFVLPRPPAPSASEPNRRYVAKIDIGADGRVVQPVELDPPDPEMSSAVHDAARFWVFAPGLTKDCKPGPRAGRIGLEYDTVAGRAWVELPKLEGAPTKAPSFVTLNPGDNVVYPRYEVERGISAGRVTVAMKLLADGTSSEHNVYFAVPKSRGFMETALIGARQIRVKFDPPLDKPFVCTLVNYKFEFQ